VNHQCGFKDERVSHGAQKQAHDRDSTAVLATALYAQDKYSLQTPSGIAFSDFRGYEDWAVVSSTRTDEVLKVIVANATMIKAYKAGVPGNGRPFPDGSKIVKLQWKPKKSTEAPFVVDVPDVFTRLSSWKRTARDFLKAADGDTRCSTTKPHRTSSRPIPAPQTAETRAIWP
jgi:Cytochrome P460